MFRDLENLRRFVRERGLKFHRLRERFVPLGQKPFINRHLTSARSSLQQLICVRAGRSRGDRLHNLRRQPEAHVFRHHFEFLHVVESLVAQVGTVSSTRHSGAEAPAVSAIVVAPFNHSGSMSLQLSIRCAFVPRLRATSTSRLEFELFVRSHHQHQSAL
jgi:hypothetical protein